MEHLITDIWDPDKGSEFIVFNKFINKTNINRKKICVHTLSRDYNQKNIKKYLKNKNISEEIYLIFYDMLFAKNNLHHANKFLFLLECVFFYLRVRKKIGNKKIILKFGQVHWSYNLLACLILRIKTIAPISGFSYVNYIHCNNHHHLYLLKTNLLVLIGRILSCGFKLCNTRLWGATNDDVKWLKSIGINSKRFSEVDIQLNNITPNNDKQVFSIYWSGVLIKRKSLDTLLNIWNRVPVNCSLTVYGSGPDNKYLNAQTSLFNNIKHIATLKRSDYLEKSKIHDLYITTSLREVNSLAFYEALIENKLIFSREIGGIRDFLYPGVYLFNDETELLKLIQKYSKNPSKFEFLYNDRLECLKKCDFEETKILNTIWN